MATVHTKCHRIAPALHTWTAITWHDWGMAQAGNRAGKTQPCVQMGENELEWVSVTSGSMNVRNSASFFYGWLSMPLVAHEVYVDDPWAGIKGNDRQRNDLVTTLLICWVLLGVPIAYHKASLGQSLRWVGMMININDESVEVIIPTDKLCEIREMALKFLRSNVIPDKELRSFIGKAMNIAGVIFVWKPFVTQLYAALYSPKSPDAPRGCTWTTQVKSSLHWIIAFLDYGSDTMISKRTWSLSEFNEDGNRVVITWDASPWGFGGTLQIDGRIHEYFMDEPAEFETNLLSLVPGSSASQQTMECLGGLIALRHWADRWRNKSSKLAIRSDNIGALVLLGKFETRSTVNNLIAWEAALDVGMSSFRPQASVHVPGFTNKTCDMLSRANQPGHKFVLPCCLKNVPRANLCVRDATWWKSLHPTRLPGPALPYLPGPTGTKPFAETANHLYSKIQQKLKSSKGLGLGQRPAKKSQMKATKAKQ